MLPLGRPRSKRLWMGGAAGLLVALVIGCVLYLQRIDAPHMHWSFHASDNRVRVWMSQGHGPLAAWDLAHSHLHIGAGSYGQVAEFSVTPDQAFHRNVHLDGIIGGRDMPLSLRIPSKPKLLHRVNTPSQLRLQFSLPIVWTSSAMAHLDPTKPHDIVVVRQSRAITLSFSLRAKNGEMTQIRLSVPAKAPPVPLRRYWFGSKAQNRVYLTIDDGWFPSSRLLALMTRTHLPITAFLIEQAVREHLAYWRSFARAGGVIEDHTVSHPVLTHLTPVAMYRQWVEARKAYQTWFHQPILLGRPPYGAVNPTVLDQAGRAGLRGIVMWSAVMEPHGLTTWNGGPLQSGDIILLHWDPGLYGEVLALLRTIHHDHLTPAPLLSGLPPLS